ncbi:MAG: hypothetical protein ACP5JJ_20170 [Anaerolineae bacterium]
MTETTIVKLDEQGAITLPESVRDDLPLGTHFLIRRQDQDIILHTLPPEPGLTLDLSDQAFDFVNELTAEEYDDYLLRMALTDASQAP